MTKPETLLRMGIGDNSIYLDMKVSKKDWKRIVKAGFAEENSSDFRIVRIARKGESDDQP